MPTPIPDDQKAAFIALVALAPRPGGPGEADRLGTILNNFEDIPTAIGRQLSLYAANNSYLTECMAVFSDNDSDLVAAGIYVGKTDLGDVSDPVLLINSTADTVTIEDDIAGFGLLNSNASEVDLHVPLPFLYIGPSSVVNIFDATTQGAYLGWLTMPFYKTPATLKSIVNGSQINNTLIDPRSNFGGFQTVDPGLECAKPVTSLVTNNITHNSISIGWVLPDGGGYLFLNIFFKLTDSPNWIPVDNTTGWYIDTTGYIFNNLEADTMYDFRVSVTCNNGGIATTEISDKTICCPGAAT